MSTPQSSPSDRPPKRMRLGTRSCVECRRRKVRCIFGPGKKICDGCAKYDAECVPQEATHSTRSDRDDEQNVHQKLASLEDVVRRICTSMDLGIGMESSSPSQIEVNAAEILRRIQSASSGEKYPVCETNLAVSSDAGSNAAQCYTSDPFADAPLLNLFRDAMLIEGDHAQPKIVLRAPRNHRLSICIRTFRTLLPSSNSLNKILAATKVYWSIWQDGQGLIITTEPHLLGSVSAAERFILDSMESKNPALVTKAVLFLALCIQQLPSDTIKEQLNLSAPSETLLDSYLMVADMFLSISENSAPTIDGLECLDIMAKLYMNMGKPRESWLCFRRAINLALLLRPYDSSGVSRGRKNRVWSHLWQTDRQMSMVLGLPAATSDLHPGVSISPSGVSIIEQIMHDMAVIAGHINERNQNWEKTTYCITLQIDQELRACRGQIPSEWWNSRPTESTPLEAIYSLSVIKNQFYQLQKLLHQPYMLKSFSDKQYEASSSAACDASREMISAYQMLRTNNGTELVICDLMDFQVFTAAIVLIIKLLSSPSPFVHSNTEDWSRVQSVTASLKKVAQRMECSVARQASQTLEYLTTAHHCTYSGPEQYEVAIPYFGKVKIKRFQPRNSVSQAEPPDFQFDNSMQFPSTIDIFADSFAPVAWRETEDFFSGAELGVDWTSLVHDSANYDWSQHFDCGRFGGAGVGDGGTFLTS